jgi:hypothetical protein
VKRLIIIAGIALIAIAGCSRNDATTQKVGGHDSQAAVEAPSGSMLAGDGWHGTVVETMNSGGYTYLLMDTGSEQKWLAGPESVIAIGDKVAVPPGMLMANFNSKTLNRTFAAIYFVGGIELDDGHTHD